MSLLPLVLGAQSSIRMYIGDHELWTKGFTSIMSDTKTEIRRGAASVIDYDANS